MTTTQPQPLSPEPPHNPIYAPSPPDCSTPTTITSQTLSSPDDWATTPRTPLGLNKRKLEVDLAPTHAQSHASPSPLGVPPELELVASSGGVKRRRSTEPDSDSETSLSLTPLEMPDGSTRFTSNWLPVDPEGGFTIGMGEMFDPLAGVGREAFVCVGD
ncbi:uncharacterized protein BDW43DRAFT_87021 [Aspergillus alliaceus]|uniref:uncharacterized protein n=1 Tax=Petromyces alliaceus TaxID=209559 RepID=UPI0012A73F70|nr:uncharacterized protein BDW43DRAFT_87021 [Aspergillus alliaceus]KAB8233416.1 hypothetical protein BDW43DRAFT_87021 [Aspergillus alliaceus]